MLAALNLTWPDAMFWSVVVVSGTTAGYFILRGVAEWIDDNWF